MLLHKLYSEPEGLFESVEFNEGINFIYAKKNEASESKESLNGVGKSLFLNLLDFCLLSSETAHIKSAKENNEGLIEYKVVLEFWIDNKLFIIKRSFKEPMKKIEFGEFGATLKAFDHSPNSRELAKILFDLIFQDPNYKGKQFSEWFRYLMNFFVKKQAAPKTALDFRDPIRFLPSAVSESQITPFLLVLMGIDNSLSYKNFDILQEVKRKRIAIKEAKELIVDTYKLQDVDQAESKIDKLRAKITEYERNIESFKLQDQYEDVENRSNLLTAKIKDLWFQNHTDFDRIKNYEDSFAMSETPNTTKIKNLYKDLNKLLADNIKKTLDEAIKFRQQVSKSREEFLKLEISKLNADVTVRKKEITELETERAQLFKFLEAKEAIKDLSEAYLELSERRKELSDLEGKIRIYRDLSIEVKEREIERSKIDADMEKLLIEYKGKISAFRNVFFKIHDAIYVKNGGESDLVFAADTSKDSKLNINVIFPSDLAKGKNKGRTLVFDLAVLFNAIEQNIRCPRFLVHDGIFDGMDKAHFVHLCDFLDEQKNAGIKFQYIVTLNQEGEISDTDFGDGAEDLTGKRIEDEAIVKLTPAAPLFGKDTKWK